MSAPKSDIDPADVATLAAWCSKSGESYNIGAWQTVLLLTTTEFRTAVADAVAQMGLAADHPARLTWDRDRSDASPASS